MKTAEDPMYTRHSHKESLMHQVGKKRLIWMYTVFAFITFIVLFPVTVVVFASFKSNQDLIATSALSIPTEWILDNFKMALERGNMIVGFKNTFILVVVSVVFNTILGSMTAYVLHRFNFTLKKTIFLLFTVAMVVPFYTTEIARFHIIKALGFYDSLLAPIIIYAGTDLLQIFIFLQFIEKISVQLDESAMMDGASYFKIYSFIIFPLLIPASATLGIIKMVDIMNDMYIPYLYMPSKELNTLSTSLMTFVGERGTNWNELSAAILIVLVPTICIYLFVQRFIFSGLSEGAIKG